MREKLEQVERATGVRPSALDHEDLSDAAQGAWDTWTDIHSGRVYSGMGVTPLSWVDLDAWCHMRGEELSYTQLELIRTIDNAYVKSANEKKEQEDGSS